MIFSWTTSSAREMVVSELLAVPRDENRLDMMVYPCPDQPSAEIRLLVQTLGRATRSTEYPAAIDCASRIQPPYNAAEVPSRPAASRISFFSARIAAHVSASGRAPASTSQFVYRLRRSTAASSRIEQSGQSVGVP